MFAEGRENSGGDKAEVRKSAGDGRAAALPHCLAVSRLQMYFFLHLHMALHCTKWPVLNLLCCQSSSEGICGVRFSNLWRSFEKGLKSGLLMPRRGERPKRHAQRRRLGARREVSTSQPPILHPPTPQKTIFTYTFIVISNPIIY